MYYVYVLRSENDGNLYIGCTGNIETRIKYHNAGNVSSTKHRRPLKLIYQEAYQSKYEAFQKEKYYKTPKGKREIKGKLL